MSEKINVVALMGKAGAGKTALGHILTDLGTPGTCLSFAGKLKDIVRELYGLSDEDVNTDEGKNRPTRFTRYTCPVCKNHDTTEMQVDGQLRHVCGDCNAVGDSKSFAVKWTPRTLLQHLGTEGFRHVDPEVWSRYAIDQARAALHPAKRLKSTPKFVVLTDCRFRTEIDAVHAVGGEVWRIRRPETDGKQAGIAGHASEREMDALPERLFDRVIINDRSIEELRVTARAALEQFLRERGTAGK